MTCTRCDGSGWLEVDHRGCGTVHPCPICNRSQYDRWASGAWMPRWTSPSGGRGAGEDVAKVKFDELRELLGRRR